MKYRSALLWGCISATILGLITAAFIGVNKLMNLYMYISLIAVGVAIILSGSLLSGDRLRANYHTEDAEDRRNRNNFIRQLLLFTSPYALIAVLLYASFR